MKMKKVLSILLAVMMILSMGATSVFAANTTLKDPTQITPDYDSDAQDTIFSFAGTIMGTLQIVGVVVAAIILTIVGIKYMMGSAEEKAEYKKTMIPYIVGAVLIFGATTIANFVFQVVSGL